MSLFLITDFLRRQRALIIMRGSVWQTDPHKAERLRAGALEYGSSIYLS